MDILWVKIFVWFFVASVALAITVAAVMLILSVQDEPKEESPDMWNIGKVAEKFFGYKE